MYSIFEPFESKLESSCPFSPKYFNVHFLGIRTLYNHSAIIRVRKLIQWYYPQYIFKFCKLSKYYMVWLFPPVQDHASYLLVESLSVIQNSSSDFCLDLDIFEEYEPVIL